MSESEKDRHEEDLTFSLAEAYPDAKALFTSWLRPLGEIKDNCLVVIDTNVLLIPYTIGPKTLNDIRSAYARLIGQGRLFIPAHVAREFAKNRTRKIEELFQQLSRKRNKLSNLHSGRYPLLEPLPEYKKTLELERALDETLKQYKASVDRTLEHIKSWTWNDPVSLLYSDLFAPELIIEPTGDPEQIEQDLARRQKFHIPPGYKDAGKEDSGVGDLLIWRAILQLAEEKDKHLLFVSGDEKSDWWHRSEGQTLYPRFELADEFRRSSNGKSFHIVRFSSFLDLFGAEKRVVEEVRQGEARARSTVSADYREVRQRAVQAETAVAEWARRRFSAERIEATRRNFPDIVVEDGTGYKTGIEIAMIREGTTLSGLWVRRVLDHAYRGYYEASKGELDAFAIALVSETELGAEDALSRVERTTRDLPPIQIYAGYVTEDGEYSEIGETLF